MPSYTTAAAQNEGRRVLTPGLVTVAIPTYNRAALAERAARSVLAQTYPQIELVVSDDFYPGDDSEDRIEALGPLTGTKTIRIERQRERLGLVRNFDACLRMASGEFFLLLGDDDVLHPTAIASLVEGFRHPPAPARSEDIGMVWCPCNIVEANGRLLWQTPAGPPLESPDDFMISLWRGTRGHRLSSMLLRTREALAAGGFEPRFGDLCDTGLWGPIVVAHPRIVCVGQPLVDYTNHAQSTTMHSSPAEWQRLANATHDAIVLRCRELGNERLARRIESHRVDHLFGVTLTILIQNIGRPGWLGFSAREALRTPRILLNMIALRRLFRDGWKLLRRKEKSPQAVR